MKQTIIISLFFLVIPLLSQERLLVNSEADISSDVALNLKSSSSSVKISSNLISSLKLLPLVQELCGRGINVSIVTLKSSLYENLKRADALKSAGCRINYLEDDGRPLPELIIIDSSSAYFGGWSIGSPVNSIWSAVYFTSQPSEVKSALTAFLQMSEKGSMYTSVKDTVSYDELIADLDKYRDVWITVTGTAEDVYSSKNGKSYFIKFKKAKKAMTVVLFSEIVQSLKSENIVPLYFLNKSIAVSGKLIRHDKYGWEIILESSGDISIME